MKEIWLVIAEFPDYAVSNRGRVKRIRPSRNGVHIGRPLRQRTLSEGYKTIGLRKNNKGFSRLVHVLVAIAFIGPRPTPRHRVAHWDGDPGNNRQRNLRWATQKENDKDKDRHGTRPIGDRSPLCKVTDKEVRQIRRLYKKGVTQASLARQFKVSDGFMCRVVSGGRRSRV